MRSPPRPLDIPELIEACLGFLNSSDLAACALVNRSWRYAAQPYFFRYITLGHTNRKFGEFLDILLISPHISSFIVRLTLLVSYLSPDYAATFVQFHFPNLHTLRILAWDQFELSRTVADGIQQLLSLPGLLSVTVMFMPDCPCLFQHIWARANIRHVCLSSLSSPSADAELWAPDPIRTAISLESLYLTNSMGVPRALTVGHTPIDLTNLKALYLDSTKTEILRAPIFAATAAPSIQLLKVDAGPGLVDGAIDLSAYSRLESFSLFRPTVRVVLDTLSTIPRENCVREIVIFKSDIFEEGRRQIKRHIATLPLFCLQTMEIRTGRPTDWRLW
ncbi:hypothetical protein B0H13DRAFT_2101220 [Mycena leptocephala]|nr:hypothetical protein B0H13DRAFT_2101220 [Mycena leptocephala]